MNEEDFYDEVTKFHEKILENRRRFQRRIFWFDIMLCGLAIATVLATLGAIYLFNLK